MKIGVKPYERHALSGLKNMMIFGRQFVTEAGMRGVRDRRARQRNYRRARPLWRKAYDAIVYVLTGRT